MMRAIEINNGYLVEVQRPIPRPAEDEVLIKVHAAGVNRPDILQRKGLYPPPAGITDIPGLEVAGIIAASNSELWQEGDEVCALLSGGGYAEYAVVPAGQCLRKPDNLSMIEAACLPETVFTVWGNAFIKGELTAGERILIHGGASGIGTTAIQMAKAAGATVIITAGTDEKCADCLKLGADQAINYNKSDFEAEIDAPIDVVLDMVGGEYVNKNINLLKEDGRHVTIAFLKGAMANIDISKVMRKRLTLTGSTLRNRPSAEKAILAEGIQAHIWPQVIKGKIKPPIFKTYPLAQAQAAHQTLEDGQHFGKIALIIVEK
jgi:NADPH2:quinone reductase